MRKARQPKPRSGPVVRREALTQRERGAALEQPRCHLAGPHLDLPQTCNHGGEQFRISDPLGPL